MISDEANHMLSDEIARMIKAHPPDEPRRYADGRSEPAHSPYDDIVAAMELVRNAPYERSPIDVEMGRIIRQFDPGGTYACPAPGCEWVLEVPAPTTSVGEETWKWTMSGYRAGDVGRALSAHRDTHTRDDGEGRP